MIEYDTRNVLEGGNKEFWPPLTSRSFPVTIVSSCRFLTPLSDFPPKTAIPGGGDIGVADYAITPKNRANYAITPKNRPDYAITPKRQKIEPITPLRQKIGLITPLRQKIGLITPLRQKFRLLTL